MTSPAIGLAGTATAFGLVWYMWWLAVIGLLVIIVAVVVRSFARNVRRIIPASEIERTELCWLSAVARATPIPREREMAPTNQGLAEVSG